MRITAGTIVLVPAVVGDDPCPLRLQVGASPGVRLSGGRHHRLDRAAVEVGLTQLEAGGDFADAVIAHQGQWLGSDTFLSFDRQAVALLQQQCLAAQLLL
jgi:hypothetical protein